ncbi:MAG: hypothetical protein ACRDSK_06520 [Actinophytocola sp.]|uniref:hypothetical protein n=1 Tax=Actinophytocola sp. TaxID=1872138 RepID=UPI003D6C600B
MTTRRPTLRGIATVLISLAGILVIDAAPASAHGVTHYVSANGETKGSVRTSSDHLFFWVCDLDADGVGVYGRFRLADGRIQDVSDPNGAAAPCGQGSTTSDKRVVEMEAVWRGGASSGWKPA